LYLGLHSKADIQLVDAFGWNHHEGHSVFKLSLRQSLKASLETCGQPSLSSSEHRTQTSLCSRVWSHQAARV